MSREDIDSSVRNPNAKPCFLTLITPTMAPPTLLGPHLEGETWITAADWVTSSFSTKEKKWMSADQLRVVAAPAIILEGECPKNAHADKLGRFVQVSLPCCSGGFLICSTSLPWTFTPLPQPVL